MDKLLLFSSIPWCLIALIGVVVAFRDKQYKNRNITIDGLGKQIFYSIFVMLFALLKGAWLAAGIWGASILFIGFAIYLSSWNRKKFLTSLG